MSATTSQLLSSGEFCKLRYDSIPVKSASANVSSYTSNLKMPNIELWHSCLQMSDIARAIKGIVLEKLNFVEKRFYNLNRKEAQTFNMCYIRALR